VRAAVVLVLMLGAATLSVVAVPTKLLSDTRPAFDLEKSIPKAFGDWTVDPFTTPIPPSPDQEAALSKIYDQILSRTYVNSRGERMMLSIRKCVLTAKKCATQHKASRSANCSVCP
jgi:hypothetical protein